MKKNTLYLAGLLVAVLVAAVLLLSMAHKPSSPLQNYNTSQNYAYATFAVQLTDPPVVPNGTQSLVLHYSNVELHELGKPNSTGFISLNVSGSVNLLNLTNVTQTLAVAELPNSLAFGMLRFNITNVTISINGANYTVNTPSNHLDVMLSSALNATNSIAIVDFNPSVVQAYSSNQSFFVFVPSIKAISATANSLELKVQALKKNAIQNISNEAKVLLAYNKSSISIQYASISQSNYSHIEIKVKNNGSYPVIIKHVFIYGYMSFSQHQKQANASESKNQLPASVPYISASGHMHMNISEYGSNGIYAANGIYNAHGVLIANAPMQGNVFPIFVIKGENYSKMNGELHNISSAMRNNFSSFCKEENVSCNAGMQKIYNATIEEAMAINGSRVPDFVLNKSGAPLSEISNLTMKTIIAPRMRAIYTFRKQFHNTLNFIVENNTLVLPYSADMQDFDVAYGLIISSNNTSTLSYNGIISFGNSGNDLAFIQNQTYEVIVQGENGAYASMSINSTS